MLYTHVYVRLYSHLISSEATFFFSRLFPSLCVRSPRETHRRSPRGERMFSVRFLYRPLTNILRYFRNAHATGIDVSITPSIYSFNRILPPSFRFHREIVLQGENSPTFSTRVHDRLCVGNSTHAYRHNARNRSSCDFSRGNRAIFTGALSIIQRTVRQGLDARPILFLPIAFAPPRLLHADRPDMFYSQVASPATS